MKALNVISKVAWLDFKATLLTAYFHLIEFFFVTVHPLHVFSQGAREKGSPTDLTLYLFLISLFVRRVYIFYVVLQRVRMHYFVTNWARNL